MIKVENIKVEITIFLWPKSIPVIVKIPRVIDVDNPIDVKLSEKTLIEYAIG